MSKNAGKYFIFLIIEILILILVGVYTFTQALQIPLNSLSAEKVLQAAGILNGEMSVSGWTFQPLELPFYLACVKLFGLSTFASISVSVIFFLMIYAAGICIIKARELLNLPNLLIWTAICGLPDPAWIQAVQSATFLILSLLLLPHFISALREQRQGRNIAACLFFLVTAITSFPHMERNSAVHPVHETIRALQTVFRADFSRQPLLQYSTGQYFLMSAVLVMMVCALVWTIRSVFLEKTQRYSIAGGKRKFSAVPHSQNAQEFHACRIKASVYYALFIMITIFFCCLTVRRSRAEKTVLCAWLPFGTALILIFIKEELQKLRFAQGKLSLATLACIFSILTILFGISPIVLSRPVSEADRVIIYLNQAGLRHGYCDTADQAVFRVASKGEIRFSTIWDDPENEFLILHPEDVPITEEHTEPPVVINNYSIYKMR